MTDPAGAYGPERLLVAHGVHVAHFFGLHVGHSGEAVRGGGAKFRGACEVHRDRPELVYQCLRTNLRTDWERAYLPFDVNVLSRKAF